MADRHALAAADVRAYWDAAHEAYLTCVGTTFQAGRVAAGACMRDSNLWLARAAGLAAGQRVLDAGCGVCGPAIDIAQAIAGLELFCVTLSARQAATARVLVGEAGLADRIHVINSDYHALPFPDRAFDRVLFLESLGYARDLVALFTGIRRVLKAGGSFYIKDVFRQAHLWSDRERQELLEFDRAYAQCTPSVAECVDAAAAGGFTAVQARDLSPLVTTAQASRVMFGPRGELTSFGLRHYRRHSCVPVYFAEITGRVIA